MTRGAGSQGANAPCCPMVRVDNAANGVVSIRCVGWAGFCVDSRRQISTWIDGKCGRSCVPPVI